MLSMSDYLTAFFMSAAMPDFVIVWHSGLVPVSASFSIVGLGDGASSTTFERSSFNYSPGPARILTSAGNSRMLTFPCVRAPTKSLSPRVYCSLPFEPEHPARISLAVLFH